MADRPKGTHRCDLRFLSELFLLHNAARRVRTGLERGVAGVLAYCVPVLGDDHHITSEIVHKRVMGPCPRGDLAFRCQEQVLAEVHVRMARLKANRQRGIRHNASCCYLDQEGHQLKQVITGKPSKGCRECSRSQRTFNTLIHACTVHAEFTNPRDSVCPMVA